MSDPDGRQPQTNIHDEALDLWAVDLEKATATHKSGFVVRFCLLPRSAAQANNAEAAGLTTIGECKTADLRKFSLQMEISEIKKFLDQLKAKIGDDKAHLVIARLAKEAEEAYLLAQNKTRH